jgi:hypothetical protein
MPRLSQWFIRLALLHLVLGFTFGALMLANKGLPLHPALWRLLPLHIELLLVGWTMQLALGVAFWILPRFLTDQPRGSETGAWLALILLNGGLWLFNLATFFGASQIVIFFGRLAEVTAVAAFAWHIWPRIIPRN